MPEVAITFVGKDQVSGVMSKIGGGFANLSSQATSGLGKVAGILGKVGLVAGGAVAAGFGAAGAAMTAFAVSGTKSAIELEQQIANIKTAATGPTEAIDQLGDLILALGVDPNLKVSTFEAADAIELLAKNGLDATQILDGAAKSTVQLANATGADFGAAADVATDVMSLFGIEAQNMSQAVNGITSVVNNSKFGFNDFALALAQGGGVAANTGVGFEDFNTTIAAISPLFASGSDAGTSFKVFLQSLVGKSNTAKEAMAELGLITEDGANQFFTASGELKSMTEISTILAEATKGLSEEQLNASFSTIFGTDAMRAAFGVAKAGVVDVDSNTSAFQRLQETMAKTDAAEAVATRMNTTAGAIEIMRGTVEGLSIKIGQAFLPAVREMAKTLTKFVDQNGDVLVGLFETLAEWLKTNLPKAIAVVSGLFQTVLIPAFSGIASFLSNTVLPLLGNFGEWLAKGLPPFLAMARSAFEDFKNSTLPVITNFVQSAQQWFQDFKTNTLPVIIEFVNLALQGFTQFTADILPVLIQFEGRAIQIFMDLSTSVLPVIAQFIRDGINWFIDFKEKAQPIIEEFTDRFQEVWEQASPVITDALTRIGDAFGGIIEVLSDSEAETDLTKEALTNLQQVLDAIVIAVQAVAVVLQGVAWGMEKISSATKIASGLFDQFGQIMAGIERKIPAILKPGSPPPLAVAMSDIGNASLFAADGMDMFADSATQGIDQAVAGLSAISSNMTEIATSAGAAGASFSSFGGGFFGATGKGVAKSDFTKGRGFGSTSMADAPAELILGDEKIFEKVQESFGDLTTGLQSLAAEAQGVIQSELESALKIVLSSDEKSRMRKYLESQILAPQIAVIDAMERGASDSELASLEMDQYRKTQALLNSVPEEFQAIKSDIIDFTQIPSLENLNEAMESMLALKALEGVQSPEDIFFGLSTELIEGLIGGTTSIDEAIAQALSGFEENVDLVLQERGLVRTESLVQNQQMNLTVNSSAPTENLLADFNMMQASLAPVP